MGAHRQGVSMYEILQKNVERCAIQVVRLIKVQILREYLKQVRAALDNVVRQQFDAVEAHQREQSIMPFFKVGLAELNLDSGELALKNLHEKVSAAARRLQEAGVNALGLVPDKVEHRLDHPRGGEYLPMISDTLF